MNVLWLADHSRTGAANMHIDRTLWRALENGGPSSVVVRSYSWSPPALSLGFHQGEEEVDRPALAAAGIDLVRRPTGGAAVLHDEEITYAVCAPLGLPGLGSRVLEIYGAIAEALRSTLAAAGVRCELGGGGRPEGFACFSAAGGHELTVDGRKLVGSALRRGRRAFVQHGSILTGPGHLRLHEFTLAGQPNEARARLEVRTTDLAHCGVDNPDRRALTQALARAIAARLQVECVAVGDLESLAAGVAAELDQN